MSKSKPLIVGARSFPSRNAAIEFYRDILYRNYRKEHLQGADLFAVLDLLKLHPCYVDKAGVGIKYIYVELDGTPRNNYCFYIERLDGSKDDFSFMKCIYPTRITNGGFWKTAYGEMHT